MQSDQDKATAKSPVDKMMEFSPLPFNDDEGKLIAKVLMQVGRIINDVSDQATSEAVYKKQYFDNWQRAQNSVEYWIKRFDETEQILRSHKELVQKKDKELESYKLMTERQAFEIQSLEEQINVWSERVTHWQRKYRNKRYK